MLALNRVSISQYKLGQGFQGLAFFIAGMSGEVTFIKAFDRFFGLLFRFFVRKVYEFKVLLSVHGYLYRSKKQNTVH